MTSSGDRHQDCGVQVQVDQHEYIIETIVNDHVLIRTSSCANKEKIKINITEHYMLDSCGWSHGGQDKIKISILENLMLDSCGCSHGGQMKMNI